MTTKEALMGWGRTLLLGDIGNRLDIDDVEQNVAAVQRHLEDQREVDANQDATLSRLQKENDDLKMCMCGLLRLLVSKNVVTTEELNKFANMIDPA
jgi:hypothetical protein